MQTTLVRYTFRPDVNMEEVDGTLLLAVIAVTSLFGETRVQLEARHVFDPKLRSCVIDAETEVGRTINQLFLGYLHQEFGHEAFTVERIRTPGTNGVPHPVETPEPATI